jgi:flagellar basal-body rod protein FlgC
MGLFGSLGISASGMTAERLRMDVIAENLANANTTRAADGGPYKRKDVVLQEGRPSFDEVLNGVEVAGVVADESPARRVYDPGHPDADQDGYVSMPNVNPVLEMVDLVTASRGYEANVQAMTTAKQLFLRTLDLIR